VCVFWWVCFFIFINLELSASLSLCIRYVYCKVVLLFIFNVHTLCFDIFLTLWVVNSTNAIQVQSLYHSSLNNIFLFIVFICFFLQIMLFHVKLLSVRVWVCINVCICSCLCYLIRTFCVWGRHGHELVIVKVWIRLHTVSERQCSVLNRIDSQACMSVCVCK